MTRRCRAARLLLIGIIAYGLIACHSGISRIEPSVNDQVTTTSCAAYRDSAQATGVQFYVESEVEQRAQQLPAMVQPRFPLINGALRAQFVVDSSGRGDERTLRLLDLTSPRLVRPLRRWLGRKSFSPARIGNRPVAQCVEMSFKIEVP